MRAVVCLEPHRLAIADRPAPQPGPGEVLVRIGHVGLCGTDYNIHAGHHPYLQYPRVMGHELSGRVVAVGAGCNTSLGQSVAINPYLSCGHCVACRRGKPNACVAIQVLGVHVDGGMCDLLAVPESALIEADGLTPVQAALVEFLAIGAHAIARAPRGERLLVVGAGPIGIACALFARADGFAVTLLERQPERLAHAARLGFTGLLADGSEATRLAAETDHDFFDVVVDATGSLPAMRRSLDWVAHGGALVLVGVSSGDISFADPEFHKRETTLIASRNALAPDFRRVVTALRSGAIRTEWLHTHSVDADDLPRRLPELARDGSVLKAVAIFDPEATPAT